MAKFFFKELKINKKADFVYKLVLSFLIFIFIGLFVWLYFISRNNLINLQYGEVQRLNKDVTYILENRCRKIDEDALVIEKYLSEGKSNREILAYLRMEHDVMSTLDPEYSDFYGYVRGEYLDGSGWIPGKDFIPKERPWYKDGLSRGGKISFSSPYVDAISGNLIISYNKLLSDKESVISYDVQLTNMQKLVDDTVNDMWLETIIIDLNEVVLADSQKRNVSHYFSELDGDYYRILYGDYKKDSNDNFEFRYKGKRYYVFNSQISEYMRQLVVVDAGKMFASLKRAVFVGVIMVVLLILFAKAIIYDIDNRRIKAEENLKKIKALYYEANTDKLTGLYNRRAYEDEIDRLSEEGLSDSLVYITFDLNGLKNANDTLGHTAGDKLLCGAAEVIKNVWGKFGKVYRIGGDEFSAIIDISVEEITESKENFEREADNWTKENEMELTISYGYSERRKHMGVSINDLIEFADKEMYKSKSEYYKQSGKDRRRR